jgi:hypothetical protein
MPECPVCNQELRAGGVTQVPHFSQAFLVCNQASLADGVARLLNLSSATPGLPLMFVCDEGALTENP